jgi:hypothetical protein
VFSSSLSGEGEGLTGVSSTNDIHWLQVVCADLSHIGEPLHVRPVLRQYVTAEGIELDLPYGMPYSGPL